MANKTQKVLSGGGMQPSSSCVTQRMTGSNAIYQIASVDLFKTSNDGLNCINQKSNLDRTSAITIIKPRRSLSSHSVRILKANNAIKTSNCSLSLFQKNPPAAVNALERFYSMKVRVISDS